MFHLTLQVRTGGACKSYREAQVERDFGKQHRSHPERLSAANVVAALARLCGARLRAGHDDVGPDQRERRLERLGAGSPGRRRPQFVHSTSVHAGVPSSIALTQSTSVGTPPVVSMYTLLLPHIVCRDPVPM